MVHYILNIYKNKIISIEKRITNKLVLSTYLTEFFTKLSINKALSPKKIIKYID